MSLAVFPAADLLGPLRRALAKYLAVAAVGRRTVTTYLVNIVSRSLTVALRVWIFTQLYQTTFAAYGLAQVGGLTVPMVVWSLLLTQSFQSAARPVVSRLIDEEVKSGALAYSLTRPYSYLLFHLAGFLGRGWVNLWSHLGLGAVITFILVGPIALSAASLLGGAALLLLGWLLEFCFSLLIGLSAFWIEDTTAFRWIYDKAQLVFGGVIMPLALFPENVRWLAELSPFAQLFYAPARLLVRFDPALFQQYLLTQLVWLTLAGAAALLLFRRGCRHVSINGG